MWKFIGALAAALLACVVAPLSASAANNSCPRPDTGAVVTSPPNLFSSNGVLNTSFDYYTTVDSAGRTLFCFMTPDGLQSPTLHAARPPSVPWDCRPFSKPLALRRESLWPFKRLVATR